MYKRILRSGFTMVELLVVMAIIALLTGILMPAVIKGRQKASVNKAKAELANLASLQSMIYLDTGGYVDLNDLDNTSGVGAVNIRIFDLTATDGKAMTNSASLQFDDAQWDGPYTTFQPDDLDRAAEVGDNSYHDTNIANREEDSSNNSDDGENGYPIDPWGQRYVIAYMEDQKVMVVYSGGPNKSLSTILEAGATTGEIINMDQGSGNAGDGDDLFYKFK